MGVYLSSPITTKKSQAGQNSKLRYGFTEMQGWRNSMEDAHICHLNFDSKKECSLFGIFDGHGGQQAALIAKKYFVNYLIKNKNFQKGNMEVALKETFIELDKFILSQEGKIEMFKLTHCKKNKKFAFIFLYQNNLNKLKIENQPFEQSDLQKIQAGCTANVVLIQKDIIYVANCGDSRTVLCQNGYGYELSEDHKPELPRERERIEKIGGIIEDGRINKSLNLSRSLGDPQLKNNPNYSLEEQLVIPVPDISKKKIKKEEDEFLLIACDGIWECMSQQQTITFVKEKIQDKKKTDLTKVLGQLFDKNLAQNTNQIYGCDNMSAILVLFQQ
ncbi:Protein phosphatase 2C (PP2C)-like domain [Pseudocohnilembus persalinus]|uniref:protein-serine/threonine phosphatase n=1 Tax=Pseudocohnilembus persalinus TaxID=266149 RepID=A0A0V0QYA9_PSEPJ|nr:Protein phosphatase 2C (PP2C)-like domain [Pseudocohnilembus persalinus]|eukprot:KRX07327.1 Protein phosphatase 2C (PP2C)-like domain [Pseudocohnilembus persalinus]